PLLSPTTYFLLFINLIGSFKVFVPVYVFTQNTGGANKAAETIGFYLYQQAFAFFHAGYAGAISVAFFLMILLLTGIQMRFFSRRVFYACPERPPAWSPAMRSPPRWPLCSCSPSTGCWSCR